MTFNCALRADADLSGAIAEEYRALADLLEASGPAVWDAPSLCEGWRIREVVAHMTMPAALLGPCLHGGAGGRRRRLHAPLGHRGRARRRASPASLLGDLRSEVLHGWQPPGGGVEGALTHCVIHGLDITGSVPLERRVPDERIAAVLGIIAGPGTPNLFGVDLQGVQLQADDLDWSYGSGTPVSGSAQALALVVCGRLLPPGRLDGEAAARFTRR